MESADHPHPGLGEFLKPRVVSSRGGQPRAMEGRQLKSFDSRAVACASLGGADRRLLGIAVEAARIIAGRPGAS